MRRIRTTALAMPRAFFGRTLLGIAVIACGVEYAIAGRPLDGLPPLPSFAPAPGVSAAVLSLILPLLGVAIIGRFRVVETSFALGTVLLGGACMHLAHLSGVLHDPMTRNRFLEPVVMACGAFVLCRLALQTQRNYLFLSARALFAFCIIAFGLSHLFFTGDLASTLPDWLPQHMMWTEVTGVCLILAGLAILTGILARPAAMLLALMFFLWLAMLDIPAMRADRRDPSARIHAEMMLGLIGAALLMSTSPRMPSLRNDLAMAST